MLRQGKELEAACPKIEDDLSNGSAGVLWLAEQNKQWLYCDR